MKISLHPSELVTSSAFAFLAQRLTDYSDHLNKVVAGESYQDLESSINLPSDGIIYLEAERVVKRLVSPQLKYIVLIGIGGSNLGTKAIYDALLGYKDPFEADRYPKMFFADTNDALHLKSLTSFLASEVKDPEEVLLIMISKSGGTTETVVNFELLYQPLAKKFADLAKRVTIISDENSPLWRLGKKHKFVLQSIPTLVGGRYSVFSAVGVFPLLACGLDVKALLQGANAMRDQCLLHNLSLNPALLSACVLFHYSLEGRNIHDTFLFHPQFESLGKWYRQLMAESIGKEKDRDGNTVHVGITPTVSIGSTDLHSMVQLYLGGPRDKVTTFVYTKKSEVRVEVPSELVLDGLVANVAGVTTNQIMHAISEGVALAYTKEDIPFMKAELAQLDEASLGQFMQWKMQEMMYLAELFNVNAFDQPSVEAYKTETKVILANAKSQAK